MNMSPTASPCRPWVAAALLLSGLVAGGVGPGTRLDRWLFAQVAGFWNEGTVQVEGFGTRGTPWRFRAFTGEVKARASEAPAVVWVGDDPDGVFQASPPSPVDYAVMFSNMQRLELEDVACGVVLAWDEPDMIGVAALDNVMDGFRSLVLAMPLTRGASAEPMPAAFRRFSMPVGQVRGDVRRLPVVNRVAVPDSWTGGGNVRAGFSMVESESDGGNPFLCARWDDRVVFSFSLCWAMQRLELPVEVIDVRLGEWIRLGKKGPVIPIDETGRMRLRPGMLEPSAQLMAEELVDVGERWLPVGFRGPLVLGDRRGMADETVRVYSARMVDELAAAITGGGFSTAVEVPRLTAWREWLVIEWMAFSFAGLLWLRPRWAILAWVGYAGLMMALQGMTFEQLGVWLPGWVLPVLLPMSALAILGRAWVLHQNGRSRAAGNPE